MTWMAVAGGYEVTLRRGAVVCRNSAGEELRSVPRTVRGDPVVTGLRQLAEWLEQHGHDCRADVDSWIMRSLPVPTVLLAQVWADEAWRAALTDLVVAGADRGRRLGPRRGGLPARRGGPTASAWSTWTATRSGCPPTGAHPPPGAAGRPGRPAGVRRGPGRRAVGGPAVPRDLAAAGRVDPRRQSWSDFAGGKFEELRHLLARAGSLGYPVQRRVRVLPDVRGRRHGGGRSLGRRRRPVCGRPRRATWSSPMATGRGRRLPGRPGGLVGGHADGGRALRRSGREKAEDERERDDRGAAGRGGGLPLGSTGARDDLVDTLTARHVPPSRAGRPDRGAAGAGEGGRRGRGPVPGVPRLRPRRTGRRGGHGPPARRWASRPGRWSTTRPTGTTRWPWSRTSSGSPGWPSPGSARPRTASTSSATGWPGRAALPADVLRAGRARVPGGRTARRTPRTMFGGPGRRSACYGLTRRRGAHRTRCSWSSPSPGR